MPVARRFLRAHGLAAANYAGEVIPFGTGAVVAVLAVVHYGIVELLAALGIGTFAEFRSLLGQSAAALVLVFAAGWTDDCIGDRTVKGMAGHLRAWRQTRTPSTGIVKAGVVAVAALWVVWHGSRSWGEAAFDWLTIVLSANAVNLLDVRPGRAWKGFLAGAVPIVAAEPALAAGTWLVPATAAGIALMPGDLRGKHMLGDSGSNLLGFMLGCSFAAAAPIGLQATALAVLVAMHRTAERSSISAWIEKHKWVRWLDRYGRV
ncbi:hypothetical protein [Paenibacillus sp. GYB003]|uniref:hypothetical protein n=1 Tax=Paenibacillus sp. GYB003 TaxID=2994392 RepID=UPI002F96A149